MFRKLFQNILKQDLELGRKIMTKFVGLKARPYSYLRDDGSKDEKVKSTKNYVIKRKLKFGN